MSNLPPHATFCRLPSTHTSHSAGRPRGAAKLLPSDSHLLSLLPCCLWDTERPVPHRRWTCVECVERTGRAGRSCRALTTLQKVAGEEERPNKINPSVMSLITMLVYMTYIAHILGCMWHWLVTFEGEGISWASKFGVEEASPLLRVHGMRRRGAREGSSEGGAEGEDEGVQRCWGMGGDAAGTLENARRAYVRRARSPETFTIFSNTLFHRGMSRNSWHSTPPQQTLLTPLPYTLTPASSSRLPSALGTWHRSTGPSRR